MRQLKLSHRHSRNLVEQRTLRSNDWISRKEHPGGDFLVHPQIHGKMSCEVCYLLILTVTYYCQVTCFQEAQLSISCHPPPPGCSLRDIQSFERRVRYSTRFLEWRWESFNCLIYRFMSHRCWSQVVVGAGGFFALE